MTVLINKWDGEKFTDGHFCDYCQKYATVKELKDCEYSLFICKSCLLAMVAEIDEAILERIANVNV